MHSRDSSYWKTREVKVILIVSTTDLFLKAFGGEGDKDNRKPGEATTFSPEARTAAFVTAFGQPASKELPTAHLGTTFRWDMQKIAKLSFQEKMNLEQYKGKSYRELPNWILDGGYAIPSESEKKHQRDMQKETGFSQSERNQIFDVFKADVEALAEMAESEVLKGSAVLDSEFARITERHGYEQVMDELQLVSPSARAEYYKRVEIKRAEKQAEEARQNASVAQEIAAAKAAIEAQNAAKQEEVMEISNDALQAELTRRASLRTRNAADSQEN